MNTNPLPSGTITILFTDIESSTALWEKHSEAMRPALAAHDELLRAAVHAHNGWVVKSTGDGLHAVFASATDGVLAALQAQHELAETPWRTISPDRITVRMGMHTGEAELRDGDYYGSHINRAARLMSLGHGGQVLVSNLTAELLEGNLPADITLRDLGAHTLRGLAAPETVYQLVDPALPNEFPPLRSDTVFVGNLPARVTSFIGRARELALVRERLRQTRLLTLVGPGGTGKTRLALQVAADVQPNYAHGAWWVELAPISDPALVPITVANALNLAAGSGMPIPVMITDYLREKEALLILDNCEHLIDATAHLAADLIDDCQRLTILASSREGLGVYGESTIHLATLTLPPEGTKTASEAGMSEAVRLFVERASAVRPAFTLTDDTAAAVSQIVRRLDGIPLAIELAAARMTVFPVEQIANRLDDRFRLLTGGSRTALPRQQTLRALIDWSYDLLDEDERELLMRLSVFSGGWSFEAAEFMADDLDVYSLLPALVNKSLVTIVEPTPDPWGEEEPLPEPRYRFLETIRQYARDRLFETSSVAGMRDRHFDYYESLAARIRFGESAGTALMEGGRLLADRDNFGAAVAWGLERYPERVIDLCWELSVFLSDQNPGAEGVQWVRAALDELARLPETDAETTARHRQAYLKGTVTLAMLLLFLGQIGDSISLVEEVLEPLRAGEGSPILLGLALFTAGQAGYFLRDPRTSVLVSESYEILSGVSGAFGNAPFQELALLILAREEIAEGHHDEGLRLLENAESMLEARDETYIPWAEFVRIGTQSTRGSDVAARRAAVNQSLQRLHRHHSFRIAAMIESDFAHDLRVEGYLDEAAEIYRRTILSWQQLGHRAAVANQLEYLAFIFRATDQPQRAVRLLGAAERLRRESGQPMLDSEKVLYDVELQKLRETLPEGELNRLWAEGRRLSTDAAVTLAISERDSAQAS